MSEQAAHAAGPPGSAAPPQRRSLSLLGQSPQLPRRTASFDDDGCVAPHSLSPARTLSDIRTYVPGHFGHFGHMSSDTSRTLAGHWPDTLGHTGHTFGQTRCAGMSKCPKVSSDTLGHFRTQRFSLSLHTTHTHIIRESIHIPSAECRLKESMGDNVSYSTQRLNSLF